MPPSERLSRGSRGAEVALGIVLLARATTAISLAVWLTVNAPGWRAAFRGIAWYALLDGGFAMLTAAMCRAEGVPSRTAIGLIYADNGRRAASVQDVELMELATAQVGLAFENELLRRQLERLDRVVA